MVVATELERKQSVEALFGAFEPDLPEVLVVPEMHTEREARPRAARFIGAVAMGDVVVECSETEKPIKSLYDGLRQAKADDVAARAYTQTNVATDMIERTLKTGHVMKPVHMTVRESGGLEQHKKTMESVQANSLRFAADHPIMRARTEAETRNLFRTEALHKEGYFDEGYCLVVMSLAENLPEAGFFTETMSCSIQVTYKDGDDLALESAFVSGVASSGAQRHDMATIATLGEQLEVDWAGKSPAEIIDMPVLIRKSLIPNGAIDVVRMWDDVNGTFFGEAKPRQDYLAYLGKCRQREAGFDDKVEQATNELIAEADNIHTPIQAVEMLHKISEKHMVEKAVHDKTIDPLVFGPVAAAHIESARYHYSLGNTHEAYMQVSEAKTTAQSYSCPSMMKTGEAGSPDALSSLVGEDKHGSLQFKCPKKGCLNTRERNKLIEKCQKCGADVRC